MPSSASSMRPTTGCRRRTSIASLQPQERSRSPTASSLARQESLENQQPPVSKIDLNDLENSQIDWAKYQPRAVPVLKPQKALRPHQQHALAEVREGLKRADRGKMIMACGT